MFFLFFFTCPYIPLFLIPCETLFRLLLDSAQKVDISFHKNCPTSRSPSQPPLKLFSAPTKKHTRNGCVLLAKEHFGKQVAKASHRRQANGRNDFYLSVGARANLRTPQSLPSSSSLRQQKNAPQMGAFRWLKSILANKLPKRRTADKQMEEMIFTFRSVLARTSDHLKASSQALLCANKKNTPEMGVSCWRREEDSNLRYVSGAHTISNRAP